MLNCEIQNQLKPEFTYSVIHWVFQNATQILSKYFTVNVCHMQIMLYVILVSKYICNSIWSKKQPYFYPRYYKFDDIKCRKYMSNCLPF